MDHQVEYLPKKTKVWINKQHRFGTDALLLSSFATVKTNGSVCDLGTGCGIILLSLIDRGFAGKAVGIELDTDACALLQGAAEENQLTNVTAIQQDLTLFRSQHHFDSVISNPPYFRGGPISSEKTRAVARHEINCTLNDVCCTTSKILKFGGYFSICYPASSLSFLFSCLHANRLEPKRMQFIRKSFECEPWLVLVEARLGGRTGLTIMPDHIISAGKPITY